MDTLPGLIVLDIMRELDPEDALCAAQVCRTWRDIVNDNYLWKYFFLKGKKGFPISALKLGAEGDVPNLDERNGSVDWRRNYMKCRQHETIAQALSFEYPHQPKNICILVRAGKHHLSLPLHLPYEFIALVGISSGSRDATLIPENNHSLMILHRVEQKYLLRNLTLLQPESSGQFSCVDLRLGEIDIEDCTLKSESMAAIRVLHDSSGCRISKCAVSSSTSSCILLVQTSGKSVRVEDCDIFGSQRMGIEAIAGNPVIIGNRIHSHKLFGIAVFEGRPTIENNEFFKNNCGGIGIYGKSEPDPPAFVVIRNNTIHNNLSGVLLHCGGALMEHNTIHSCSYCAICIRTSDPSTVVSNNFLYGQQQGSGIRLEKGALATIQDNEIHHNEYCGIISLQGSNSTILRNKIFDNRSTGLLIYVEGTAVGNTIYNNVGGIEVRDPSSSVHVSDNDEHDNEKVSPLAQAAIDRGYCTFTSTSVNFVPQYWFRCLTCALPDDNNSGCCVVCAEKCHKTHKLSTKRFGLFFCDCVSEWKCFAKPPHQDNPDG
ncbi:F-box only protein 11 [Pelomyxa schiedti]|nr:F-box only protein 11 [Pelomyxa schiedti]